MSTYDPEPPQNHNPIIRATVVGSDDPGLKDPTTGDRLRLLKLMVLEADTQHLWYNQAVLVQADE